jgi:hypothetical protein
MALTPAPAPPAQTPAPGATAPAAATAAPAPKKESRFSRGSAPLNFLETPLDADGQRRYPLDIGNSEEYPHYVVFYPLVREGTKRGKELLSSGGGRIFDQTDQNRVDPENGKVATGAAGALIGAPLGAAAGAGLAKSLGATLNANGGKTVNPNPNSTGGPVSIGVKMAAGLVGGILGAGAGAAAGVAASAIAGEQRLVIGSDEIVLYIPDKMSTGYNANYETADLGALIGGLASGKASIGGLFTEGTETADYMIRKAGRIANIAGFDQFTNVLQATSKKVENPYKEQLFRSMGFRKFSFDYRFSPRNADEAEMVFGRPNGKSGILELFTSHMHPTMSPNGLFQTYPSEFMIIYYHNGEENTYVRKISNCVLTDMAIDYGAEGFTTFDNGCPTEAFIRLQFSELETLTTDRIEKGY